MKRKTKIGAGLILVLTAFMAVFMVVKSFGADSMYLNIVGLREGDETYTVTAVTGLVSDEFPKTIWKIVSYDSMDAEAPAKYDDPIYCVNPEIGFGNAAVAGERKEYNYSFNMKDLTGVAQEYRDIIPNTANYNSVLWILDNMYLPKDTNKGVLKSNLYNAAKAFGEETNKDYDVTRNVLTDNDIEVVQQLALWYFTSNSAKYHYEPEDFPSIALNGADMETNMYNGPDKDSRRYNDMKKLYAYFINSAKANQASYGTTDTRSLKVPSLSITVPTDNTLKDSNIVTIEGTSYYKAGPYKIKDANNSPLPYFIDLSIYDQDDAKKTNCKFIDSTNTEIEKIDNTFIEKDADHLGQDFYIAVPVDDTTITSAKIKLNTNYVSTDSTLWTHNTNYATEQPVVIPVKTVVPIEVETPEIPIELNPEFDLALRKIITKINGVEVNINRDPEVNPNSIDKTGLIDGSDTTATYTHPKNALTVEVGDLITYKIRVYNEGEVDGYAEEITDHIPDGLEFVFVPANEVAKTEITEASELNVNNGWVYDGNDLKTIKTDHLKYRAGETADDTKIIKKFDKDTGTLSYQEVELVLKVVKPTKVTDLTAPIVNIAEITKYAGERGAEVEDRDSQTEGEGLVDLNNYELKPDSSKYQQDDDDYEPVVLVIPEFDLALRKFITKVNSEKITSRIPDVDASKLNTMDSNNKKITTAEYNHPKDPVLVKNGDKVTYTIRIYNEGEMAGYAQEITDNIPEGLKFDKDDPTNIKYSWKLSKDGTKITTDYLSKAKDSKGNLIAAFDKDTMTEPAYKDVEVVFEVIEPNSSDKTLINIAEISDDADKDGNPVDDRDSKPGDGKEEQDDIDKEYLKLENYDLALRKFITKVGNKEITSREPEVTNLDKLADGTATTATYTHPKDPVAVKHGDTVVYTIRVYNEGKNDGTATEITDYVPEGLEFVKDSSINTKYKWKLSEDGKTVSTEYLAKEVIEAFDKEAKKISHKDVQIEFEVTEPDTSTRILRNIAEIAKDDGDDEDSNPDNVVPEKYETETIPDDNSEWQEDDDDYEPIKLQYFDLALRKFITKVNVAEVTDRIPVPTMDKDGKISYNHKKDAITVANNDIVIYTIRVYNEGTISGYAKEVSDDVPQGLTYLPKHEINIKYDWTVSEDGKTVSTDYLSKEKSEARDENNLIKAFDKDAEITEGNPDYRDIQIAFKVTETNLATDRVIINTAEITDDSDEDGEDVTDIDSEPGNKNPDEDDIDKEYLKVKYFDLSLLKWVSKAIVTENGQTVETKTGHTGLENPEPIVKVDLDRKKINDVTVKFEYTIKITNEGEIEGYAKEISDYIPSGLKFVKGDNPDWQEKDGKIVTRKLENTLLKPGQSATVTVILTWINKEDNMGLKVNVAEISEDYNEHNSKDIDSTPNNKKDGEDDIDDAPVILTIKTGMEPTHLILIISSIAILTTGIILIKKFVLK